jgi:predicted amidohydrolase YtcJ
MSSFDASADVLVVNSVVRTLDAQGTVAEAVAVRNGHVQAVGRTDDLLGLRSAATEVIDGQGRTVLPAFTDSHTHLRRASLTLAYFIDFMTAQARTMEGVLAEVRARALTTAPGSWIRGDNYLPERIAEGRFPTRYELDQVAPANPVVLCGLGRHVITANSLALQLAGIDRETPNPDGGRIELDDRGEPTGVLHERAKLRLDATRVDTVIPPISETERVTALAQAMGVLHASGIASIHEIVREPIDLSDYLRLRESGGLSARVRFYVRGLDATTRLEFVTGVGLRSGFGDDWLRFSGIKFSIDGLETACNAATYDAYPGDPCNVGLIRIPAEDLREAVQVADAEGLQVAIHAIGPRAVDIALDSFEAVAPRSDGRRLMHRLEHAYMPATAGQWERVARLGLLWSTQPSFMHYSGEAWQTLGREGATPWMPLGTAHGLGIRTQINSDYPCSPINPLVGIAAAVTRRTEGGVRVPGDETITVDQALRAMTNVAALDEWGMPGRQGSLEPGKFADIVMLSDDPYGVSPDDLVNISPVLTMIDGAPVFRTA